MQSISDEEIVFSAGEDLYNETKTQIILYKNTAKSLMITSSRIFQSYCHEFCGRTGLSYKTIRFQIASRDIKPETIISNSCVIAVNHKAEFQIEPTNSLKSSLRDLIDNGMYSDILLKVCCEETNETEKLNAHRCILSIRSNKFSNLLSDNDLAEATSVVLSEIAPTNSNNLFNSHTVKIQPTTQIDTSVDGVCTISLSSHSKFTCFMKLVEYIYSGEIAFPANPIDVFEILK